MPVVPDAARKFTPMIAAIACALALNSISSAQVVIDMPVPKKPSSQSVAPATPAAPAIAASPAAAAQPAAPVDIGDVALSRYARARTYPRDTYRVGDRYAGIRQYGYPFPIWWGGFGFPHIHVHGNKFTGFVGRSHCR